MFAFEGTHWNHTGQSRSSRIAAKACRIRAESGAAE
jgi:hypothetical protein